MVASEVNAYEVMKSVWKKGGKRGDAMEQIESLNEIVGHIRHNVKKLTEQEKVSTKD